MSTSIFLRSTTSDQTIGTDDTRVANFGRGTVATNFVTNTVTGTVTPPTNSTQFTVSAAGSRVTFLTPPLKACSLTGTVTTNIRGLESNASANCTLELEALKWTPAGGLGSAFITVPPSVVPGEMAASEGIVAYAATIVNTSLADGDRIAIRIHIDDGGGTMATGFTAKLFLDGPTASATGDTFLTWQNLAYFGSSSGNGVLGGSAGVVFTVARTASGNGVFGGTAPPVLNFSPSPSGNAVLGSSVTVQPRYLYSTNGNGVLGGTSQLKIVYPNYTASGNGVLGSSAQLKIVYPNVNASGNAVLSGTSATTFSLSRAAAGGSTFNGSALTGFTLPIVATGSATISGTAPVSFTMSTVASGGMVTGGRVFAYDRIIRWKFRVKVYPQSE